MADINYNNGSEESRTRQRIQKSGEESVRQAARTQSPEARARAAQRRAAETAGRSTSSARPQGTRRPSQSAVPQGSRRPSPGNGSQRRPSAGYDQARRTQAKRKRKSKFKKGLLAYAAFLVLVIIVGAIMFSTYLSSYEKSRPYVTAASVVKSFSTADGIEKLLKDNADKTDVIGDTGSLLSSYASNVVGKQISYVQNSDFRTDAPSYNITADGKVIAQVVFENKGSTGWGFSGWDISKLKIAQYMPDMTKYTVIVPQGSTVYLDGTPLDSSYITDSGTPKVLKNVTQYLKAVPTFDTYTIPSMNEPTITVKDAAGTDLALSHSDTTFSATKTDQAFIDEVYPNTEATLDVFAKYFIHESFNLSAYMLKGTPYYIALFGDDESYGVDTSLYNFEHITDYGYDEKEIKNFVRYTDDCYTVDVKYHLYVNFDEARFSDDDQRLDATWVFVYDQDKADWFLADSQFH